MNIPTQYGLRTLLILMAVGPPVLAVLWFYTVPVVTSLAFLLFVTVLSACLFGALLGRTMLWGIEGLLAASDWIVGILRRTTRRRKAVDGETTVEFSLSRYAAKIRGRRIE